MKEPEVTVVFGVIEILHFLGHLEYKVKSSESITLLIKSYNAKIEDMAY